MFFGQFPPVHQAPSFFFPRNCNLHAKFLFLQPDGEPMIEAFVSDGLFFLCFFAAGERMHKQCCNRQRP